MAAEFSDARFRVRLHEPGPFVDLGHVLRGLADRQVHEVAALDLDRAVEVDLRALDCGGEDPHLRSNTRGSQKAGLAL